MTLKHRLKDYLSEEELALLVRGFDVVGDIAIIIIPEGLETRENLIAEAVLASNSRIRVVAKRTGNYGGEFRTLPLTLLAGEKRKETEVKESGIRMLLNPESVYYSIRSASERRRVASLVEDKESVMVFFSGVAPFPLIISRFSSAESIVGIEKNPVAHMYGVGNLQRNKKLNNIRLYLGDVAKVAPGFGGLYDRVVMPLPTQAEKFLACGLQILKPGGWLHFYDLQQGGRFQDSVDKVVSACGSRNREVRSVNVTRCGHTAPRTYRICVDARIE